MTASLSRHNHSALTAPLSPGDAIHRVIFQATHGTCPPPPPTILRLRVIDISQAPPLPNLDGLDTENHSICLRPRFPSWESDDDYSDADSFVLAPKVSTHHYPLGTTDLWRPKSFGALAA